MKWGINSIKFNHIADREQKKDNGVVHNEGNESWCEKMTRNSWYTRMNNRNSIKNSSSPIKGTLNFNDYDVEAFLNNLFVQLFTGTSFANPFTNSLIKYNDSKVLKKSNLKVNLWNAWQIKME